MAKVVITVEDTEGKKADIVDVSTVFEPELSKNDEPTPAQLVAMEVVNALEGRHLPEPDNDPPF